MVSNQMGKEAKKTAVTDMDDWFVLSRSIFDCTSNQILVIGPPSKFDDTTLRKFSERLEMRNTASALALTQSLHVFFLK